MSILSALYIRDDEIVGELIRSDLNYQTYHSIYKGHLYCPTSGCPARVVFVSGQRNYFMTWKNDDHKEDCMHHFDRHEGRPSIRRVGSINVPIPEERIQASLKSAYLESTMSDEELERRRERRAARRRNNPITTQGREIRPRVVVAVDNSQSDGEASALGVKPPNLLKRDADALRDSDIGMTRIIKGCFIKDVTYNNSGATITVVKGTTEIPVLFGEAFIANSPNALRLFHYIERILRERGQVRFTAMGQVRLSQSGDFELIVFGADRMYIENMTLLALAAHYAAGA